MTAIPPSQDSALYRALDTTVTNTQLDDILSRLVDIELKINKRLDVIEQKLDQHALGHKHQLKQITEKTSFETNRYDDSLSYGLRRLNFSCVECNLRRQRNPKLKLYLIA